MRDDLRSNTVYLWDEFVLPVGVSPLPSALYLFYGVIRVMIQKCFLLTHSLPYNYVTWVVGFHGRVDKR